MGKQRTKSRTSSSIAQARAPYGSARAHVKTSGSTKIERTSASARFRLPVKDAKTGSYTTPESTKILKRGATTFASALKRLAEK